MPVYEYTALNEAGKNVTGIIDADSAMAARQKLRGSGVFPIEVKETSARQKDMPDSSTSVSALIRRVKPGELSVITRQLAILLGAGVTLVASLDASISQTTNPLLKRIVAQVKESVNQGNSLAHSLSQHPKVFSPIYINMVRAGEASGTLDLVLERLAEFSERQQALRGRFRAALAYPIFMALIGVVILFVLLTFVVPQMTQMFTDMHQTLPLPTLLLIGVGDFLKSFWWVVLIVIAGGIILLNRLIKTPKGRRIWDGFKLRIPMFGVLNSKMAMARFGRTLGSLLQGGVPLISALRIVRNIVNNVLVAEVLDKAMEDIEAGKNLTFTLSKSRWFPSIAVQMIAVGEQSGEVEKMLDKVADIYEGEVESQMLAMTSMLEPIMILAMGVTVGFIVVAILLPIFEMNQLVR